MHLGKSGPSGIFKSHKTPYSESHLYRFMTEVISAEDLAKAFYIGAREETPDTFVGMLSKLISSPIKNWRQLRKLNTFEQSSESEEEIYWALKGVSFGVKDGEVLGIIGRNGAGKSTLLKVLSRITEPTRGKVTIRGQIGRAHV